MRRFCPFSALRCLKTTLFLRFPFARSFVVRFFYYLIKVLYVWFHTHFRYRNSEGKEKMLAHARFPAREWNRKISLRDIFVRSLSCIFLLRHANFFFLARWEGTTARIYGRLKWLQVLAPSGFHQVFSFPNIQPEPILMTLFVSKIVKRKETSPFSELVDCCWNFRRWHHRKKLIDFTLASCYVICLGFSSDDTCCSYG